VTPSPILAPVPRHQLFTIVGGWCDANIQLFLNQVFLFSGVSVVQNAWSAKLGIFGRPSSKTHDPPGALVEVARMMRRLHAAAGSRLAAAAVGLEASGRVHLGEDDPVGVVEAALVACESGARTSV
jgi:hypothetical protein